MDFEHVYITKSILPKSACNLGCPSSWVGSRDNMKCYKLFSDTGKTFSEAHLQCQQEGAHLINVETIEENFREELLSLTLQEGTINHENISVVWLSRKEILMENYLYNDSDHENGNMCVTMQRSGFNFEKFKASWAQVEENCNNEYAFICERNNTRMRNGGWSEWVSSECSIPCGNGTMKMERFCNNPEPQYGGADCEGENIKTTFCNQRDCRKILVKNAKEQLPEFVLKCEENYWIIGCDSLNFDYLFLIDQSGNFAEETERNQVTAYNAAFKKPGDMDSILKNDINPGFLFKIQWSIQHNGYFLRTSLNKFIVSTQASDIRLETCNSNCNGSRFIWRLWKIEDMFLSFESLEKSNFYIRVESGHLQLNSVNELFTGINTNFIKQLSLKKNEKITFPALNRLLVYGDVVIHYYSRTGEIKTGFICDYNWDLADAAAVCRDLGYDTGLPTYNGQFTIDKNPYYAMSGVRCEEGTESFKKCPFKLELPQADYFVQVSMDQYEGAGYGCNRGTHSDAAGVVCGSEEAIRGMMVTGEQCENYDAESFNILKTFTSLKTIRETSKIMSESKEWFDLLLALPMTVSQTSRILLESSQFEEDLKLTTPSGIESPWESLWGDSLQTNLIFLAHYLSNAIEKANFKLGMINYNTKLIRKYLLEVSSNAFSKDEYEYKSLLQRHLKIIYKYTDENIKQVQETFQLFKKAQELIQDLLFALNVDKLKQKSLEVLTKPFASLQQYSKEMTVYFERFLMVAEISHSTFKHIEEYYNDISLLKGAQPKKSSIRILKEMNGDLMAHTLLLEKMSRFYCKFSESVLLETNMNSFYLNLKKIDDNISLDRYRRSLLDQAKTIQAEMMKQAAREEAQNDDIGSQIYEIRKKFKCDDIHI